MEVAFPARKSCSSIRMYPLSSNRSPEDAESKDRSRLFEAARLPYSSPALVFLGVDDRPDASRSSQPAAEDPKTPKGVPYFALDAGKEQWDVDGGEWGDARASASAMSGWEAGIFAQSRALLDWNMRNRVPLAPGNRTNLTEIRSSVRHVGIRRTRSGEVGSGVARQPSTR